LNFRISNPQSPIPALERLRRTWSVLGEDDPLWAILSDADKRGGRWDVDAFFAAGEGEIAALDTFCSSLMLPAARRLALDFGCGVGRLSRALASRYAQVIGVDISPSMLAQARTLHAQVDNVRFVENATTQLGFIADATVDLIYSVITLHHNPAPLQLAYLAEFLRVLAPGGVAVFQIATGYSRDWRGLVYRCVPNRLLAPLRRHVHDSRVAADLHVIDEAQVLALVVAAGKRIVAAMDTDSAGRGFRSRLLFVA
jgi:SAM-dependent methyltransferase